MKTSIYRRHHKALRELLDETSRHLLPLDADACRAGLAKLAALLRGHLAMEDRLLYPRMMTHDNAAVRRIARRCQAGMGHLAPTFEEFYDRWIAQGQIEAAPAEFAAKYRLIAAALRQRIDLEDTHLYRLVDEYLT